MTGLIRGVTRTAVVAGTARAVPVRQLRARVELRDQGILTEQECAAQKSKILGG